MYLVCLPRSRVRPGGAWNDLIEAFVAVLRILVNGLAPIRVNHVARSASIPRLIAGAGSRAFHLVKDTVALKAASCRRFVHLFGLCQAQGRLDFGCIRPLLALLLRLRRNHGL